MTKIMVGNCVHYSGRHPFPESRPAVSFLARKDEIPKICSFIFSVSIPFPPENLWRFMRTPPYVMFCTRVYNPRALMPAYCHTAPSGSDTSCSGKCPGAALPSCCRSHCPAASSCASGVHSPASFPALPCPSTPFPIPAFIF